VQLLLLLVHSCVYVYAILDIVAFMAVYRFPIRREEHDLPFLRRLIDGQRAAVERKEAFILSTAA
jgi:hypothetical protein